MSGGEVIVNALAVVGAMVVLAGLVMVLSAWWDR
jgi:hypothetical protein